MALSRYRRRHHGGSHRHRLRHSVLGRGEVPLFARREWREMRKTGAAAVSGLFAYDVVRMGLKHGDERIRELLPA